MDSVNQQDKAEVSLTQSPSIDQPASLSTTSSQPQTVDLADPIPSTQPSTKPSEGSISTSPSTSMNPTPSQPIPGTEGDDPKTTSTPTPLKPTPQRNSSTFSTYSSSNSPLLSSRPAPASPAPSRRSSAVHTPAPRDRAPSNASSSAASTAAAAAQAHLGHSLRRSSNASNSGAGSPGSSGVNHDHRRPNSKPRPRSSLGTSILLADGTNPISSENSNSNSNSNKTTPFPPSSSSTSNFSTPTPKSPRSTPESPKTSELSSRKSSAATPLQLQESLSPSPSGEPFSTIQPDNTSSETIEPKIKPKSPTRIIIRDYAFPSGDDRYRGIPLPELKNSQTGSPGGFGSWKNNIRRESEPPLGISGSGGGNNTGRKVSEPGSSGGGGGFSFGPFGFGSGSGSGSGGSGSNGGGTDGKNNGGGGSWSGLNLLGWRGFLGRRSSSQTSSSMDISKGSNSPSNLTGSGTTGHTGHGGHNHGHGQGHGEVDIPTQDDYAFESSSDDDDEDDDDDQSGSRRPTRHTNIEGNDDDDDDDEYDDSKDDGRISGPTPEPIGMYRVVYPFIAEGEHEISVDEGEILEIKGRGGGEGWVVAIKGTSSSSMKGRIEGLVPESYLERVDDQQQQDRSEEYDGGGYEDDEDDSSNMISMSTTRTSSLSISAFNVNNITTNHSHNHGGGGGEDPGSPKGMVPHPHTTQATQGQLGGYGQGRVLDNVPESAGEEESRKRKSAEMISGGASEVEEINK